MQPTHIEHIGIAVADLEPAVKKYEEMLGFKCYKIEAVPDQKVRTAFFRVSHTKIELLQSTDPDGPIGKFIENRGEGLHHIAFAVENIQEKLQETQKKGFMLIDVNPRKGADGLNFAFLHPKSTGGVLIEICEHKQKP
ncbi:MAG: methylmalonyl-CoA epimerase [Bacteroidales bacterium]